MIVFEWSQMFPFAQYYHYRPSTLGQPACLCSNDVYAPSFIILFLKEVCWGAGLNRKFLNLVR